MNYNLYDSEFGNEVMKRMREKVGKIIRQYREEQGYLQEELAKIIGVSKSVMSTIESGKIPVSDERLESIINALDMEIGDKIRLYREAHDYSQSKLAELVGVDQPVISRIEAGILKPNKDLLERISKVFQLKDVLKITLVPKPRKKNKLQQLDEKDLMQKYNDYHAILIRILRGNQDEYGELFPAILDIKDLSTGELVAIYGYDRKRVLRLDDYNTKWIAYVYNEAAIDEEKNPFKI